MVLALAIAPARADFAAGEAALARKDWRAALDQWLPLAEDGDARAQAALGGLYYNVLRNYTDGAYWYRKAAEQGDARAQTQLGLILVRGAPATDMHGRTAIAPDRPAAAAWLRKAAEQGFAAGQYYYGLAHASGWGVEADDVEAVQWYRRAAEQGYPPAEFKLGEAYLTGKGAPTIPAVAVEWLTKAAEKDAPYAQFALGSIHESGRGVARDPAAAAGWYRRAAALRHVEAAYRLGLLHAAGQGVAADYAEAYRLIHGVVWRLPTQEMNMQARRTLDVLAGKLSPAQIQAVERPELERLKQRLTQTPARRYR